MDTTRWTSTLLALTLITTACVAPAITGITILNAPVGATSGVPEVMTDTPVQVQVTGSGVCPSLAIHYGDNTPWTSHANYDLAKAEMIADHAYIAPPIALTGFKSITAHGDGSTCVGEVTTRILVTPEVMHIGWALGTQPAACADAPTFLQHLMKNTAFIVDIPAATPGQTPVIGTITIGGHQFDADGDVALAPGFFPFPGKRMFSVVVLETGMSGTQTTSQVIQGGKHFSFRTTHSDSHISFCYNSNQLPVPPAGGVEQGFIITFRADASQAIIP